MPQRDDPARIARDLRRIGPGTEDTAPEEIGVAGGGVSRYRDPACLGVSLCPSPALVSRPDGSPVAALPATRPTFSRLGAWHALRIPLGRGADVYGVGEVAGPLRRNGQTVSLWNTDAFGYRPGTTPLYQSHPWAMVVRPDGSALGVLADSARRGIVSVGPDLLMAFEGGPCEVYLIERALPGQVGHVLAGLTGAPPLPPRWALGYHQCRWSYESADRVREIASGFRERRLPCDVLWMDIDYMRGFRVFSFDPERFPDPAGLNEDLHDQGFRTVWMIDPGVKVDEDDPVYQAGREGDHFIRDASGEEYQGEVWPGACAFPDFTRARTREWWAGLYPGFMATGIDGVWNDMNEPAVFDGPGKTMPDDNRHDADEDLGGPDTHDRYHNLYGMQMVRASREGIAGANPDKRPFVLTRSNFLGGHRYAATWTGDNTSDWEHLHQSITMALSLGLSGQPFAGPDIGGFDADADGRLFARWMGIGTLLPFARGHSVKGSKDHEPWSFGEECERICRVALERRMRLLPYLYTVFVEAMAGTPVVRPLFFADPTDPALRVAEDSFLLGPDVLVRARTRFTGPCRAAMPKGRWARFEPVPPGDPELPELFLRAGAILPLGPVMQHEGERALDPLTLVVHPDREGGATGVLEEDEGDGYGRDQGAHRTIRFDASASAEGVSVRQTVVAGDWALPERELRVVAIGGDRLHEASMID